MDLSTVKSFIGSSLDIMKMSEAKYASFRIVRQDHGNYRVSLLLNSATNLSGRRNKSKAKIQRDAQRKKDFLSRKSAINPKSPEPISHKEPQRVGTGNTDNTSRSPKNSVAGAGADQPKLTGANMDHPESPDVHPNPEEPSSVVEAERSKTFPKTFSEILSTPIRAPIATTADEITVNDEIFTTPDKSTTQSDSCSWEKAENCAWFDSPYEGYIVWPRRFSLCEFHRVANNILGSSANHTCKLHVKRSNILIPCESGNYCFRYVALSQFYKDNEN